MATNIGDRIPDELLFFTKLANGWGWYVDSGLSHLKGDGSYVFIVKGFGYRKGIMFRGGHVFIEYHKHIINNKFELADPECFNKMKEELDEFVRSTGGDESLGRHR